MKYRDGTPEDAEAIARINVTTWQTCFRGIVPQAFLDAMNVPERAAGLGKRFSKTGYTLAVAEDATGKVVGFCDFGPPRNSHWPYDTELYAIYVQMAHQREGIGSELFRRAVDQMISKGGRSLFVRVLEVSPFQTFYARCGGHIADREDNQIEGQKCDHLIYAWDDLRQIQKGEQITAGYRREAAPQPE